MIRGHLPLEYIFAFCKSHDKITKGLGFEPELWTWNRKQGVLYSRLGVIAVNVTIKSMHQ